MPRLNKRNLVKLLALLTGLVLLVIGVRFLFVPHQAARSFGMTTAAQGAPRELHYAIGLRDIWLAAILMVLAVIEDWRGMALWLGLGACVCFGDAVIVANAGAKGQAIAFHVASGVFCTALALACWRQHRRAAGRQPAK